MSASKGVYDFVWSPQVVASVNTNGDTPLHLAARHNDVELARELILKGASWDVSNKEGVTPADIAQTKLFTDITKLFTGARAAFLTWCKTDPSAVDVNGHSKLMKAAARGDEAAVKYLLTQRVPVNTVSPDGYSALSLAVRGGHLACVKMLADKGADVTFKDHDMPLPQLAATFGHADIELLLKERARMANRASALTGAAGRTSKPAHLPPGMGSIRRSRMVGTASRAASSLFREATQEDAEVEQSLENHIAKLEEFVIFTLAGEGAVPSPPPAAAQPQAETAAASTVVVLPDAGKSEGESPKPPAQPQTPTATDGESSTGAAPVAADLSAIAATAPEAVTTAGPETLDQLIAPLAMQLEEYQELATEERQTALDALLGSVVNEISQLFTAATNKFNGQFVDITAQAVHQAGEIITELRSLFKKQDDKSGGGKATAAASDPATKKKADPVREKLLSIIRQVDADMRELALKTKVAAGVWPPPEAAREMVEAAFDLFKSCRELVQAGNATGAFEYVEQADDKEDGDVAYGRMINYREYRRQRNLNIIGQIAQVDQSSPQTPQPKLEEETVSAEAREFLDKLDALTKDFVSAVVQLKSSRDAEQKDVYLANSDTVCNAAQVIARAVSDKLAELKERHDFTDMWQSTESVRSFLQQTMRDIVERRNEVELRAKMTQGVWPPPDAADNMMNAAKALVSTLKQLVATTKELVLQFKDMWESERLSELQRQAEWERKLLQNVKIEKLDTLVQQQHTDIADLDVEDNVELTQEEDTLLHDPNEHADLVLDKSDGSTTHDIVKGGSIEQLVVRLTFFRYPDPHYRKAFLLTYQSFMSPLELLRLVCERFEMMPPPGLNETQFSIYFEKKIKPTRLRIFNVLKAWIEDHFDDWANNPDLVTLFKRFLETRVRPNMPTAHASLTKTLMDKFEGLQQKRLVQAVDIGTSPPILPKGCKTMTQLQELLANEQRKNWMLVDPVEMARQMTLIEFSMYTKIQSSECLGQGWNGKKKHIRSPNITNIIDHTNKISAWVATKILESPEVRDRVKVLRYFIEVAMRCREINNFNSATSIVAALESSPVHRLKRTWEQFHEKKGKHVQGYEELLALTNAKGNYSHYRRELHSCNPPVTPFLGVYLTDLTFIEDGNSKYLPNSKMVNFDKCRKISKSIEEIRMYQQNSYRFVHLVPIQDFLCSVRGLDERLLYKRSLEVEPREETPAQ